MVYQSLFYLFFTLALLAGCDRSEHKTLTVEQSVNTLLYGTAHGLTYVGEESPELVEKIEAQPEQAVAFIAQKVNALDLSMLADEPETDLQTDRHIAVLIQLLGFIGNANGDHLLGQLYKDFTALTQTLPSNEVDVYERMNYLILDNLNGRYQALVVEAILHNLNSMSETQRQLSLNYLIQAGQRHEDIREKLKAVIDQRGKASGDPHVLSAYEVLSP